jgi:DNA-binding Xre family transcriptional regulator
VIDSTMPIQWKLRQTLASHGITPYALAVHIGMQPANMYRLLRGAGPKVFDREMLSKVIQGLRELSRNQDINIQDVLEVVRDGEA